MWGLHAPQSSKFLLLDEEVNFADFEDVYKKRPHGNFFIDFYEFFFMDVYAFQFFFILGFPLDADRNFERKLYLEVGRLDLEQIHGKKQFLMKFKFFC